MANNNSHYDFENDEIKAILRKIDKEIGENLAPGWGFNLILFSFGEGGGLFYISNAKREDVIRMLKEYLNKLETTHK